MVDSNQDPQTPAAYDTDQPQFFPGEISLDSKMKAIDETFNHTLVKLEEDLHYFRGEEDCIR
jgi:hypothetical protein